MGFFISIVCSISELNEKTLDSYFVLSIISPQGTSLIQLFVATTQVVGNSCTEDILVKLIFCGERQLCFLSPEKAAAHI